MADNRAAKFMKEKGSILMYAMLVISAILSTTLVVSNFIRSSARTTRALNDMDGAFYAAESGAEKTLYQIRKTDSIASPGTCTEGNVVCSRTIGTQNVYALSVNLPQDKTLQFELYTPELKQFGSSVESMGLTWDDNGSKLEVSHAIFNASPTVTWQAYPVSNVSKFIYSGGSVIDNSLMTFKNYIVRIKPLNNDANNLRITLNAADNLIGVPRPFPNYLKITSIGTYGNATFPIVVNMNRYAPTQGMYDYVLFSEGKIVK